MARQERKFHYIYKITCKVTNKFYVGMHSTDNMNDGYFGSGTKLSYSKRKHGLDNHTKEILEFLNDRESLKAREIEIITEDFIKDPLCMNLKPGGYGGFCNESHSKNFYAAGGKAVMQLLSKRHLEKLKSDPDYYAKWHTALIKAQEGMPNPFLGKKHTAETKQILREKAQHRTGDKNSQYGTCWITNELENKKIHKGDIIPNGWRLGRKIN